MKKASLGLSRLLDSRFGIDHGPNVFVAKHSIPFFTQYRRHIFYDSQSLFSVFNEPTPTFTRTFDSGFD